MAATIPPFVRLLEQEREVLSGLLTLAGRQEAAMIAGDLVTIDEVVGQESALLQREARIAQHLSGITRSHGGVAGAIAALPEEQRRQAGALRAELLQLAAGLNAVSSRLKALADAGLTRVEFLYQVIARGAEHPGPYRAVRRPAGALRTTVLNRRI